MKKQKIHWFEWDCPAYQGRDDSYTNAPGLITCKRCSKKLASRRTQRAADFASRGGIYLEPVGSHDTNPFTAQDESQSR